MVVGLFGPWGVGKTSALNLLREHIIANKGERDIFYVPFNPWSYDDSGALIASLFGTIAGTFAADSSGRWQGAARALTAMGTFLTVASKGVAIAGVSIDAKLIGDAFKDSVEPLKNLSDAVSGAAALAGMVTEGDRALTRQKTIARSALAQLSDKQGRLVVAIDDVDRVSKTELLQLLKTLRVVAELPNVTVVVAMDDDRVRDVLSRAVSEGYGQGYLDKIVQVPVHVPLPDTSDMKLVLARSLESVIVERGLAPPDELRPSNLNINQNAFELLLPLVKTPRDLVRYANSLRLVLLGGGDPDVHVVDAALLEALHVFFPDVYSRIRQHGEFLTRGYLKYHEHIIDNREQNEKRRLEADERMTYTLTGGEQMSPIAYSAVRAIVLRMFGDLVQSRSRQDEETWAAERRIRSSEAFGNYFRYAPVPHAIPKAEVEAVIERVLQNAAGDQAVAVSQLVGLCQGLVDTAIEGVVRDIEHILDAHSSDECERYCSAAVACLGELPPASARYLISAGLNARVHTRVGELPDGGIGFDPGHAHNRGILTKAVKSLPLFETLVLLDQAKTQHWLDEGLLGELRLEWLAEVAVRIQRGYSLFNENEQYPGYTLMKARVLAKRAGADSPLTEESVRDYAVVAVEHDPANLLAIVGAVAGTSRGIYRLTVTDSADTNARDLLVDIFGDVERLKNAFEGLNAIAAEDPTFAPLINDIITTVGEPNQGS